MKPIASLSDLDEVLEGLQRRDPPLVVNLTPDGVKRGARITHGLYPEDELESIVREEEQGVVSAPTRETRPRGESPLAAEVADLRHRVEALEERLGIPTEHETE